MFNAQRQLKVSIDEHHASPERMEAYVAVAGSSEIYLRLYAKALVKEKKYEKALSILCKAEKYTSSPSLFTAKATCLEHLKRTDEAIENIETVCYMVPDNDDAKFKLMMLYKATSHIAKMEEICREILSINKPESKKVNYYKCIADSLLKRRGP
jgi:tetratricopeptide (TPR) repeat protein